MKPATYIAIYLLIGVMYSEGYKKKESKEVDKILEKDMDSIHATMGKWFNRVLVPTILCLTWPYWIIRYCIGRVAFGILKLKFILQRWEPIATAPKGIPLLVRFLKEGDTKFRIEFAIQFDDGEWLYLSDDRDLNTQNIIPMYWKLVLIT